MLEALDEVTLAPIPKAPSFAKQLANLNVGDSAARVRRLAMDSPEAANLTEYIRKFRISIDAQVSRERTNLMKDFVVEQGTVVTATGFILVVVAVTRT